MAATDERVCNPISNGELERRWSATRARMRSAQIDALVIQGSQDWLGGYVRWFTGLPANNGYPRSIVFPLEGLMTVIEQGPFDGEARLDGKDPMHRGVGRKFFTPSFPAMAHFTGRYDAELAVREISKAGYRTVGLVCAVGMYHGFAAGLAELLKGVKLADASEFVDQLKAVKSPEEIEFIRRTAAMQDETFVRVREHIRAGMKDFEVAAYAQYVGQLLGSEQGIYLCSSAPPGQAAPFKPRSQQAREIQKGDTFTLLVENNGPGGFFTELSRTFVLGKTSQELTDALGVILEAQQDTLKGLKPGANCRDIHKAHTSFMQSRGLPGDRRLYCHGQGYDLVERPLVRPDDPMIIAENMNIVVHPVLLNERLFMTNTDNYLIGSDGPGDCIHRTPKEIIEVV